MLAFGMGAVSSPHVRLAGLLASAGLQIRDLPDDTSTAALAARALGVRTKQIVKSLVLIADTDPILVLASGDREVNIELLKARVRSSSIRMARAAEVKTITGFPIGGVPPVAHSTPLRTFMDRRLFESVTVFAAAGTKSRIFEVSPKLLAALTYAEVTDMSGP